MSAEEREGMIPEMSVVRTAAIERLLIETVQGEPAARRRRVRSRVLTWGTVGVVAIAAATAGAAFIHGPAPVTNSTLVHCLANADHSLINTPLDDTGTIATTSLGAPSVNDYIASCTVAWRHGVFDKISSGDVAAHQPDQAPKDLTVCVLSDGTAAVVPGAAEVCDAIGLARWQS